MDIKQGKILYFIQLPPPIHGVSTINSIIYNSEVINRGLDKQLLEIRFSENFAELRRFNLRKLFRFFSLLSKLKRNLREERPDIVYYSVMLVGKGFWRDLFFVRAIKKSGCLPIYHLHNKGIAERSKRKLYRKLYRYIFKDAVLIHLSENLITEEIKPLKSDSTRMFVVPNGIPDSRDPAGTEPSEFINLLFVSNLFAEKGIYDLIQIMSELRKFRRDIRLKISGDFMRVNFKRILKNRIDKEGLEDVINIIDPVFGEEKEREFDRAHMFIFPSYFPQECFPLVLIEAMRHQLPIISSYIGAIPEMIEDKTEGLLIQPRDLEHFTQAIIQLANDPVLREKMGLAGRRKYLNYYTQKHLEDNVQKIYKVCFDELI